MALTRKQSPICVEGFREFIRQDPLQFNQLDISYCQQDWRGQCGEDVWGINPNGPFYYNHEELIDCLCTAYDKVARFTSIYPTLQWTCDEYIEISDNWWTKRKPGIRLEDMVFQTDWKMVKDFGVRDFRKLDEVSLVYNDNDEDKFSEVAYGEFAIPESQIEPCDIKFMYPGTNHEICPVNKTYDPISRTICFTIDAWNLVNPELYAPSWKKQCLINACDIKNFLTKIDVWVDGIDTCKPHGVIEFEDKSNCKPNCERIEVPFCVRPIDNCMGYFKISLLSWGEDGCVSNKPFCILHCHEPIRIKFNYRSGCGHNCLDGCQYGCECSILHTAVYKMAAACLPYRGKDCCACLTEQIVKYQREPYLISQNNERFNLPASIRNNPDYSMFGFQLGEIEAAVALERFMENFCDRH